MILFAASGVVFSRGKWRAKQAKQIVETELRRVMSRTERLAATPDRDGMLGERHLDDVAVRPDDVRAWRTFSQVSRDIADEWEAETGRQWTQPLGYSHAIWEVALDALKRSGNPLDKEAVRDAIRDTNLDTLIGNVNFSTGPHPNVSTTPIFGGQWKRGEKWRYDLKIVDNSVNQLFEPEDQMAFLPWAQ
jgi:hypothetical protein